MSMTSGPMVPVRIGKLTEGEPSEKLIVAVRSVMAMAPVRKCSSGGAQLREQRGDKAVLRFLAAGDQIPQLVVRQVEETIQHGDLVFRHLGAARREEAREDEVVFQHAAPAAPLNP